MERKIYRGSKKYQNIDVSSSTVIYNPTANRSINENAPVSSEEKASKLLIALLWIFSTIYSAANIDFGANFTGISVEFNVQDVILVLIISWMLHQGLKKRNVLLILPWVAVSAYGLYYNHYDSLLKMMGTLKTLKHTPILPWIAFLTASLAFVLRLILIQRILQLSAQLWYRKKLERELYESEY